MRERPLGTTGLRVSEIGFGAWGIGGSTSQAIAYGPVDDQESRRALQRAFDLGVTFYDTAALYGDGRSERLIGEAFRRVRSRVVIASKVGMLDDEGRQEFSPAWLRASLETSLARLQTDYLDLYQLHDPPRELLEHGEEVWATLQAFSQEGRIRAFGVSVATPTDAVLAVERGRARCVQVNFNLLDQRALELGLFERCWASGVGIIGRTPLCFGFLTGAYNSMSRFETSDHRSRWSAPQRIRWAEAHRVFAPIQALEPQTSAQFALRFCLSYPAISTVIPGMLTAPQVEENVAAGRLGPLPNQTRRQIEQCYHQHQFFLRQETPSAVSR